MTENFFGEANVTVHKKDGRCVPVQEALKECDYFMIYFSAHWCYPCRHFTPKLKAFFERHHHSHRFEVLFLSLDRTEAEMQQYFESAHGDWWCMAHPYAVDSKEHWFSRYKFRGIPTLLVFKNGPTPTLMTSSGRSLVGKDSTAQQFPWNGVEISNGISGVITPAMMLLVFFFLYYYVIRPALA